MRQNTMKTKLYSGEPAVGVSLTFPSSHMVEILAHCGFDWVLLDCEHGSMTAETVETMIMASELAKNARTVLIKCFSPSFKV